jgi:hypothetical protein
VQRSLYTPFQQSTRDWRQRCAAAAPCAPRRLSAARTPRRAATRTTRTRPCRCPAPRHSSRRSAPARASAQGSTRQRRHSSDEGNTTTPHLHERAEDLGAGPHKAAYHALPLGLLVSHHEYKWRRHSHARTRGCIHRGDDEEADTQPAAHALAATATS